MKAITDSQCYVPLLKAKEGEFGALEALDWDVRTNVVPLIEVPRIPYDYASSRPSKNLEAHVSGLAERIRRAWGEAPFYLDLPWFGESTTQHLESGHLAVSVLLHDCIQRGIRPTAVVALDRSPEYIDAVRQYLSQCEDRFCLRLTPADFDEDRPDPRDRVDSLLERLGVGGADRGDLIVDLQGLELDVNRALLLARGLLSAAPRLNEWRRVVLAAASFPENLSDVDAETASTIPRLERELWQRIRKRPGNLRTDLAFGDYAIAHPVPTELDPRTMRMSASIRYTTEADWLIVKGRNVRQYGFDQYYKLCKYLVTRPEYSGADYSWGDWYIQECANANLGPGNATTWRKVGTNHHLTLVAKRLSIEFGS